MHRHIGLIILSLFLSPPPLQSSLLTEGKFGSRKLEQIYREEQLKMINTLNDNLDKELSISASGINAGKEKRKYNNVIIPYGQKFSLGKNFAKPFV